MLRKCRIQFGSLLEEFEKYLGNVSPHSRFVLIDLEESIAISGKNPSNGNSLFSPENGLLMSTRAEAKFNKGHFVVVPTLPDNASLDAIREWHTSSKKNW